MSADERMVNDGYEDVVILSNYSYDTAVIGVSEDGRAIYDFDLMVEWLMAEEGFDEMDAIEWIEYNTLRALPYMPNAPIVMHRLSDVMMEVK